MRLARRIILGFVAFVAASALAGLTVRRLVPEWGDAEDPTLRLVAAMDGREVAATSQELREIDVIAVMGGVELDLTGAQIVDGAVLKVTSVMGGVEVTVPPGWRVEARPNVILAGFENRTDPDDVPDEAPVLIVDALLVMSGLEVSEAEVDHGG